MNVYGIEVTVVLKEKGQDDEGNVFDRVITGPDARPEEDDVRRIVREGLETACAEGDRSVAVVPVGVSAGFPVSASAKIIAQEISRCARRRAEAPLKSICCLLPDSDTCAIFEKNVLGYLDHMITVLGKGPYSTVDGIIEVEGGIVLIERKNPPFGWALPGGFVDYGEDVEAAVVREVKEETNLEFVGLRQFRTYSAPERDPRFHTISLVFYGRGRGELRAADDAQNAGVFSAESLPEKMAFDHRQIIEDYLREIKK